VVEIARLPGTDPAARALVAAMEAWGSDTYGPFTANRTSMVEPEEMVPPRGEFVVLRVGGAPVAGGGVRGLGDGVGEVKRMYVEPALRGRGLGRRLLAEIEAAARDLGFCRLRLDTAGDMGGFYERAGYAPIDDYNGNGYATFWGEKVIA
jgi:GNAT superfamily N-acetyltransferase